MFLTTQMVRSRGASGGDRVIAIPRGVVVLIAAADRAGGMAHGAAAADAIISGLCGAANELGSGELTPATLLADLDLRVQSTGGQSTGVIALVGADGISGASVGDSGTLQFDHGQAHDLT